MLHHVEREIRDDASDPRTERIADPEASDVLISLHERLLREILGIMRIARDAPGDRDDPPEVF